VDQVEDHQHSCMTHLVHSREDHLVVRKSALVVVATADACGTHREETRSFRSKTRMRMKAVEMAHDTHSKDAG
jgi:hypothetical protein